jgi:hypothetical protein
VTLHNLEEALTFQSCFPLIQSRLLITLQPWLGQVSAGAIYFGLAVATIIPWAVAWWSMRQPSNMFARWLVLLVQAVVLVNVFWHVFVAEGLLRGYAPGLVTAMIVNLPASMYVFHRVAGERWFSRVALLGLMPAALFVHGPVLIAVIYFGARIAG